VRVTETPLSPQRVVELVAAARTTGPHSRRQR
jgi:hypothetical protein